MLLRTIFGCLCLFFSYTAAFAAEGPIIITQSKALQGGVSPGDRPGFPIEITREGVFRLAGDISIPRSTNGIVISVPHVTIDLGNFTIGGGRNVISANVNYLTIRNGRIEGSREGGIVNTSRGAGNFWRIENVTISGTRLPAAVENGGGIALMFRNNIVTGNVAGVYCGDYCHIEGSIISGNLRAGISIRSGAVLGNTIISNGIGIGGSSVSPAGIGNNTITGYGTQVQNVIPMTPNACTPAC